MTFRRALQWIILSTLVVSGIPAVGFLYFHYHKSRRSLDDQYRIVAIVQTTSQKEALKTVYFAELLDLSFDKPTNLYAFDTGEGQKKLLSSPLVKRAVIKKITPGTLYIDYDLRLPIAFLGDLTNTAIDEEGVVFPFKPFFTPKRLPDLILGLEEDGALNPHWGTALKDPKIDLGLALLEGLQDRCSRENTSIKTIDVSKAFVPSYGQREIVIILEKNLMSKEATFSFSRILRVSSENYSQALANYFTVSQLLSKQEADLATTQPSITNPEPVIVDLRIPHLAFIKR